MEVSAAARASDSPSCFSGSLQPLSLGKSPKPAQFQPSSPLPGHPQRAGRRGQLRAPHGARLNPTRLSESSPKFAFWSPETARRCPKWHWEGEKDLRGDPGGVGWVLRPPGAGGQCQGGSARWTMPALLLLAAFQPLGRGGETMKGAEIANTAPSPWQPERRF